jgi:hypothetical protein
MMKTKTMALLMCITLGTMSGLCSAVLAQQGHESTAEEHTAMPATVGGILAEVDTRTADLDKTIAAEELEKVHVTAFKIRDLLLTLPEKAGELPAPSKTALTASLTKIKQQAGLLDKYGDAGDLAQTKAVFTKFTAEIAKIKQIPGLQP